MIHPGGYPPNYVLKENFARLQVETLSNYGV